MKSIYPTPERKAVGAALRTFDRRQRDRVAAARMALAFFKQAEVSEPISLPNSVKRLFNNEMAQLVISKVGARDTGNVETRVWKPSLSVIHIAAAFAVVLDVADHSGLPKMRIDQIARSLKFIERVVQTG